MEPAPELVVWAQRWLHSWTALDLDRVLDAWSRHPGIQLFGPDPEEVCEGFDQVAAMTKAQFPEIENLGGVTFDADKISAWQEGTVGWVTFLGRTTFGSAEPQDVKMTMIVHEDGAFWRAVLLQLGFDVPNEESVGTQLTTALDGLLLQVQDEPAPVAGMSADGSVIIMFTDLEGSTALMESLGEERWLQLLEWHDAIVQRQTANFGGAVVKGQGDGFMLAFPAAGSASACAMAIQRSLGAGWTGVPVRARIGMHVGNAKAEGGDFFGRTVVVAARVAGMAEGEEILVTQAVQERLDGAFALEGPRTLSLKGLSDTHSVFAVSWH